MSTSRATLLLGLTWLFCAPTSASYIEPTWSEATDPEQALRQMQHEIHREYGVRSDQQLEILDQLVALYLNRGDSLEAVANASFAYELRLELSEEESVRYQAYQGYGDALAKTKFFGPAERVYRKGLADDSLGAITRIKLLVSIARMSRVNPSYLRTGVLALEKAIAIAQMNNIPELSQLKLSLADMRLVSGDVVNATKIYGELWLLEPTKRSEWFGSPKLLKASSQPSVDLDGVSYLVRANGRATKARFLQDLPAREKRVVRNWMESSVFRPKFEAGRPQDSEVDLAVLLGS